MELQALWSWPLDFEWCTLTVGAVFKSSSARIILAGTDGRIHILAQQKAWQRLAIAPINGLAHRSSRY